MRTLLLENGADFNLAKDFINTKLLGHRFELLGHGYIFSPNNEFILVDFEGFFLEFSLGIIQDSLDRFIRNFSARHLQAYFGKIHKICQCLQTAGELIKYQHYTIKIDKHANKIDKLLNQPFLLIPATYQGHAITFIKCGNLFAKCDRGANSRFEGSVVIYKVGNPQNLNPGFLRQIIFKKQTDDFMHADINEYLGLTKVIELPIGAQVTGNCSWANVEAAIPTMLLLLLITDKRRKPDMHQCINEALDFYHEWREWDKDRALDECIQGFQDDNEMRNASKAITLASLLFQTCNYTDDKHLLRAEKILRILSQKQYHSYLESYIKIYHKDRWTEAGENLMHLFDMIGNHGK